MSGIQYPSSSAATGQSEVGANLEPQGGGLVTGTGPLVNPQVSSFDADGSSYTLVSGTDTFGPGTCPGGTCRLTTSLVTSQTGYLIYPAGLCSGAKWGTGCNLGYGCCLDGA